MSIWISAQSQRRKMFPGNRVTNMSLIKSQGSLVWFQNGCAFYIHLHVNLTCFSAVVLAIFSSMRVQTSLDISSRSSSLIFSRSLIKGMSAPSSEIIWFRSAWMALPWPPRSGSQSWSLLETFSLAEMLLAFFVDDEISCRCLDYLMTKCTTDNVQNKDGVYKDQAYTLLLQYF